MKTIWKYPLQITDRQNLFMPPGSQVLSAHLQNGEVTVWALVSPDLPQTERHEIEIIGTGNVTDHADRRFLGTVLMHGDRLVWHIFERT